MGVAGLAKPKREKQDESFTEDDQVRGIDMEANITNFMIQDSVGTEEISPSTDEMLTPNIFSLENPKDMKYTDDVEMKTSASVEDLLNFANDLSEASVKDEETITPSSLSFTIDEK